MAETNENPLAGTGKDPWLRPGKASMAKTRKTPVIETIDDSAETREDSAAGPSEGPVAGMVEAAVPEDFEILEAPGNAGSKAAEVAASSLSEHLRMLAAETTGYSKESLELGSAFAGELLAAKSLVTAVQVQIDYAKSGYVRLLAHLVKMSDLYCNLFKTASTPVGKVAAKIEGVKA